VCCSVLLLWCSMMKYGAACCSVFQHVSACHGVVWVMEEWVCVCCSVLQCGVAW